MTSSDRNKLKWRCRRGTRELDALMEGYLAKRYPEAVPEEQCLFERLTEMPDPELYDLLIGRAQHANEAINRLTASIRAIASLK